MPYLSLPTKFTFREGGWSAKGRIHETILMELFANTRELDLSPVVEFFPPQLSQHCYFVWRACGVLPLVALMQAPRI
jgi:hypothetical protein